jgi:hypothetical protein
VCVSYHQGGEEEEDDDDDRGESLFLMEEGTEKQCEERNVRLEALLSHAKFITFSLPGA